MTARHDAIRRRVGLAEKIARPERLIKRYMEKMCLSRLEAADKDNLKKIPSIYRLSICWLEGAT